MNINIQSLDFTAKEDLLSFVNQKVSKLSHYYDKIISSEVCLSLDKSNAGDNKVCDIRLVIPGNDLIAKAQCKSFEEATSEAYEALMRQIEKRKSRSN
ncbi:MAG: ribosome hibernation-promoting factor, HPF/YfiA family [Ferruginibacter sp.]